MLPDNVIRRSLEKRSKRCMQAAKDTEVILAFGLRHGLSGTSIANLKGTPTLLTQTTLRAQEFLISTDLLARSSNELTNLGPIGNHPIPLARPRTNLNLTVYAYGDKFETPGLVHGHETPSLKALATTIAARACTSRCLRFFDVVSHLWHALDSFGVLDRGTNAWNDRRTTSAKSDSCVQVSHVTDSTASLAYMGTANPPCFASRSLNMQHSNEDAVYSAWHGAASEELHTASYQIPYTTIPATRSNREIFSKTFAKPQTPRCSNQPLQQSTKASYESDLIFNDCFPSSSNDYRSQHLTAQLAPASSLFRPQFELHALSQLSRSSHAALRVLSTSRLSPTLPPSSASTALPTGWGILMLAWY